MGKDTRKWRKEVKKLRRKRIRKAMAFERDNMINKDITKAINLLSEDEEEEEEKEDEDILSLRENAEKIWIFQEEQSQLAFKMKQAEQQALAIAREANEKKIRIEWEEIKKLENEAQKQKEIEDKERSAKQEDEFNKLLDFLSGDIDNPPQPFLMPEELFDESEICSYFARTATCRFFDRCSKAHPKPTLSSTIMIQNFFSHFSLEQSLRDEFDTDISLEYEDADMNKEFFDFYEDVIPEFRAIGNVIQFKVCCNFAPHLRGNVFVQYDNIREAVQAYRTFNARYYNKRQLTLQFVKVPSWKSAICGLFNRRKCTKGKSCNYFHVFRNPTKEFVSADNDWAEPPSRLPSSSVKKSFDKGLSTKNPKLSLKLSTQRKRNRSNSPKVSPALYTRTKRKHHSRSPKLSPRKERNRSKSPKSFTRKERNRSKSPNFSSKLSTKKERNRSKSPKLCTRKERNRSKSPKCSTRKERNRSKSPKCSTRKERNRSKSPKLSTRKERSHSKSPKLSTQKERSRSKSPNMFTRRKERNRSKSPISISKLSTRKERNHSKSPKLNPKSSTRKERNSSKI